VNLLKKYAKVNLGLVKLYMSVDVDNVGAIKCYKSSGFKEVSLKMECELF